MLDVQPVADVLGDRAVQHLGVLGDVRDVATQGVLRDAGDVLTVDLDEASVTIGEAQHQLGQRRLARAGGAHEADVLARLDPQIEAVEQRGTGAVGELQRAEVHPSVRYHQIGCTGDVDDVRPRGRDAGELGAAPDGARHQPDELERLLQAGADEGGIEQDQVHHAGRRHMVQRQDDTDRDGGPVEQSHGRFHLEPRRGEDAPRPQVRADGITDEVAHMVLLPVLGRLATHGGQVGDGVGDHARGPGVRVREVLLRGDDPIHTAMQHDHEHRHQRWP